jgi:hypothetical protein
VGERAQRRAAVTQLRELDERIRLHRLDRRAMC